MKNTNKEFWKQMLLVMIAIITICGLTGCMKQEPQPVATEVPTAISTASPTATAAVIIIDESTPIPEVTPAPVTVETEGFSLTYSGTYAESVNCRELMETAEIDFEFTVTINETAYTIFKVVVGEMEGDIVTMMNTPDGASIPVSFYMSALPEGLSDDNAFDFYIAQDVVNEVIDTLEIY